MFCDKCGKQIPDDSVFCPECGVSLIQRNKKIEYEANIHTHSNGDIEQESAKVEDAPVPYAEQGRSATSGKASGQSAKEFFFKNGKINILGWACVIGPVLAIALIISIIAGINSRNKKSVDVATEETKTTMGVETEKATEKSDVSTKGGKEQKADSNKSFSNSSDDTKSGGVPEDVYEKIKGTYFSGVNFIAYKVISPTELIYDNGTDVESIKIEKYEYKDDALIMYVDSGSIVQSWKDDKGNYLLSLMEGGGWDYEKSHCYSTLERISEYTSVTFDEIMATYYSTKYYAPDFDVEKRTDGYLYLVAQSDKSCLYPVDGGEVVSFPYDRKIVKDAQIGLAESYYYDSDNVLHFNYKYYDLYDTIDSLFSNGHWVTIADEVNFKVDGQNIPLCPIITLDPNMNVDLFLEGFWPNDTSNKSDSSTTEEKSSEAWYGEILADGDAYEGGMPEETYEQIKGKYSDSYRMADIISPNQIKFGFIDEKLTVFDIYGCDVANDTLYIYAIAGDNQCMFSVKKDNNAFVLKYCMGHWNSNQFAPDATLFKE